VLLLCGDLTEYGLPEEARNSLPYSQRGENPVYRRQLVIMIMNPESRKPLRIFSIRPA